MGLLRCRDGDADALEVRHPLGKEGLSVGVVADGARIFDGVENALEEVVEVTLATVGTPHLHVEVKGAKDGVRPSWRL
jgi:hypothetical protein